MTANSISQGLSNGPRYASNAGDTPLLSRNSLFLNTDLDLRTLLPILIHVPLLLYLCHFVHSDYKAFLALGPGGTPSNFAGYLKVTFLKLWFARKGGQVFEAPEVTQYDHPARPFLASLPCRNGPRPTVAGIAPHRQLSNRGPKEMLQRVTDVMRELQASNSDALMLGVACFESHDLGLYFKPRAAASDAHNRVASELCRSVDRRPYPSHHPSLSTGHSHSSICPFELLLGLQALNPTCRRKGVEISHLLLDAPSMKPQPPSSLETASAAIRARETTGEEIFHTHAADNGSSHVSLHPLDAALVIHNGWGEMHPLAGRGSWVPRCFVMVYGPRDEEEVRVVREIVRAGAWWVGGCILKDIEQDQATAAAKEASR